MKKRIPVSACVGDFYCYTEELLKPIVSKLLRALKDDCKALFTTPKGYKQLFGELSQSITILDQLFRGVDLVQEFLTSKKELEDQLGKLKLFVFEEEKEKKG